MWYTTRWRIGFRFHRDSSTARGVAGWAANTRRGVLALLAVAVAIGGGSASRAAEPRLASVTPTVLLAQEKDSLLQIAEVVIESPAELAQASLEVRLASGPARTTSLGNLKPGKATCQIQVPAIEQPTPITLTLMAGGKSLDHREMTWQPPRRWQVHIVPVTHHDLGYTDTIENVLRKYDGFYDDILRFCDDTRDWPFESRYRYTAEGTWSVQHFVENRPKRVIEKLGQFIREGRIEIPALFGNELGALCSHEELIRLMYPSFRLKRELGATICTASITDVPGLSWGLPSVLSGAGVKYFFAGLPGYFQWGGKDVHDFWDEKAILPHGRPDAFRWEGPDGGSVLVYFQGGYGHFMGGIGPGSYEEILKHLPGKLEEIEKQGSPLSVVRYIHNGVDNFPPDLVISRVVRDWNERWAWPKLVVSTNTMFFQQLEKQCKNVRTFRGELPDTDYVVGAAATALETGINRVAHDRLHAAEKFATMASLLGEYPAPPEKNFWITTHGHYPEPTRTIGDAYDNMLLYDEHTWGMAHQVGVLQDWSWSDKGHYAYRAAGLAESILGGGLGAIADRIALDKQGRHLVVFNPLSIPRTDVVRVPSKGHAFRDIMNFTDEPFELIDEVTGRKVPYQVVKLASPRAPVPHAAQRYARGQFNPPELCELVFVAEEVPSLGWKTYRMASKEAAKDASKEPTKEDTSSGGVAVGDNTLENRFYKLVIDPQTGAIKSLQDKELSREMVDRDAPHQLNQLVVRQVDSGRLETPQKVTVEKGLAGPVYASLVVTTAAVGCPQVTQEVILYDKIKRVDLANRFLKDSTPMLEFYFAMPFKIDKPQFHFEGSHSVIRPLEDQFPGSNSNYYAAQHWADASDGRTGVTLSAVESHLLEFGGLWPCYVSQAHHGVTPPGFGRPFVQASELTKGYMYAFVLDSNFRTNFPPLEQADLLFRYAITTHQGTWKDGKPWNFGWAVANPLLVLGIDGKKEGPLPTAASFCQVDQPDVFLLTLKRAEDGQGIVLRLVETEGRAVTANVTLPQVTVHKAFRANLVEENQGELSSKPHQVTVPLKPFQTVTIRVQPRT